MKTAHVRAMRDEAIQRAYDQGQSYAKLGRTFGLTPQRVQQIVTLVPVMPRRPATHVYIVQTGMYVKIGVTGSVPRRLTALRSGLPSPLHLRCVIPGGSARERALHVQFQAARLRADSEWFQLTPEIEAFIQANQP